jgi:hypothetical protein
MLPKKYFSAKLNLLYVSGIFLFLIIALLQSCKKTNTEFQLEVTKPEIDPAIKFFNLPINVNPSVKKVADKIKIQNDQKHFLNQFVKAQGYPLWDKALITNRSTVNTPATHASLSNTSSSTSNSSEDLIFIPLVLQDSNQVHGALSCKVNGDSVYIRLIDGSNYSWYTAHPDSLGMNGEQVTLLLMKLDKVAFGHSLFRVTDSTAFGVSVNSQAKYIKITDSAYNASNNTSSIGHWEYYSTTLYYVTYESDLCGCAPNIAPCPDGSMHPVYHSETLSGSIWVEDEPWYDPNGGGTGGGGGSNNGGGGGGPNELPVEPDPGTQDFGLTQFIIEEFNSLNVANPCLNSVINTIGQTGCGSLLLKEYQNYFGSAGLDKYKIKFFENNSLVDDDGNTIAGHTNVNILATGVKEVVITINPTYLQNASKEFITAVVLHELLHGFYTLKYPNSTFLQQHQSILNSGAGHIGETLLEIFPPGLSPSDAAALGLQGIDKICFDSNGDVIPSQNAIAETKYGMGLVYARNKALEYFNGTLGTPC